MGSLTALTTALMNLCVNAADAMTNGGTLTIRTAVLEAGSVDLIVEDTGHGMTPEVLTRAMEPFYTTKGVGKGTGLGLSMVYGTVQAHGGVLALQSRCGQGTVARISLPIANEERGGNLSPGPLSCQPGVLEPLRILLVDDDPLVREATLASLENQGHCVTAVSSGYKALGLIEDEHLWDLVVLDLNMPNLGGLETLKRIRSLRADLPVIVASGYADAATRADLEVMDRVTVLCKPYTRWEFQQALWRHL